MRYERRSGDGGSDVRLSDNEFSTIEERENITYSNKKSCEMSHSQMTGVAMLNPSDPQVQKMKKSAFVQLVEQPAGKGLRFRYECEGRSAGSIPGVNSTVDNRTFPTIKVMGYTGRAVVVVSAVTAEAPYRPHPHNLVGKEGSCKKGVCTMELGASMTASFSNLGIQCVKKKDIEESLTLRQQIRVDPFQTGFSHKTNPQNIDLNCLRLAFQVFLEGNEKGAFTFALKPVVSDPIYDKKAKCDLTICRMTEHSAPVAGGKEILLFCDKITKDDIQVRFFEEANGRVLWEGLGDFQPSDVHKQFGICFRTPRYKNIEIEQPVRVQLQLKRPSDGAVSECRPFDFIPLDAGRSYWAAKRLKTNYTVFNQILGLDQANRQAESELKHKVARASPTENLNVVNNEDDLENIGAVGGMGTNGTRQTLRPVAMPGFCQQPVINNNKTMSNNQSGDTDVTNSCLPPQVPVRSPHKSNLLTGVFESVPQASQPPLRPISDMSLLSDFSNMTEVGDTTSINTRHSVNEILSMADMSVYSGDTVNLDSISVNSLVQNQPVKDEPGVDLRNPVMGSMTSVATVKENKKDPDQEPSSTTMDLDMDIGQIYDDVMQCVYDDVDMKYDDMNFIEPPVPPERRRGLSVDVEPNKPLPGLPRNKIITKFEEKKNEIVEKKKVVEEQKKKEREAQEEMRKKEREERERKKLEEREKKKVEEELKRAQKKKEEEDKKSKKPSDIDDEAKMKQSLFQRLFQRSQSRPGDPEIDPDSSTMMLSDIDDVQAPPPVPPHLETHPPQHHLETPPPHLESQLSIEGQLSDLEQLIQCENGTLERLDNVVTEFTNQFGPTESQSIESSEKTTLVHS